MEGIEFEEGQRNRNVPREKQAPKIVAFLVKYSRGYVPNKATAVVVLLVFSGLLFIISFLNTSFGTGNLPPQLSHHLKAQ